MTSVVGMVRCCWTSFVKTHSAGIPSLNIIGKGGGRETLKSMETKKETPNLIIVCLAYELHATYATFRMNFTTIQPHNVGPWSESNNSFTSHGIVVIYFGYSNKRIYIPVHVVHVENGKGGIYLLFESQTTTHLPTFLTKLEYSRYCYISQIETVRKLVNKPAQILQCMQRRSQKHCCVMCH